MNNADMDPIQPGELYHEWTEQEAGIAFTQAFLEGQEYHPSPTIIPDTRVGFDADGSFHAVEHFTIESIQSAITPFRWAQYLQDAVEQYASTSDYTMGASDRDDFVQDVISERMELLDSMEDRYMLEEALEIWRSRYHYGA